MLILSDRDKKYIRFFSSLFIMLVFMSIGFTVHTLFFDPNPNPPVIAHNKQDKIGRAHV